MTLRTGSGSLTGFISTESVPEKEDLYTALITKAPYMAGDVEPLVPSEEIPWLDKSLLDHSIGFYRRNFSFAIASNTFALMIGFCVKSNSAVLLRTGKLYDPELSFQRYLSTIQRIGKFFMIPFDKAKAYKAFDTVRKMHALASKIRLDDAPPPESFSEPWKKEIAEAIRLDLDHIDTSEAPEHLLTWTPSVPVSQFDMVLTQFGFIGTMWLFPRVFGIVDRHEEMKGVIHMWALFGRLLGIKDEFNVCINPDPELYDKLFKNIILPSLKSMDESVVSIQSAFMEALSYRLPFVTYKAMLFHGLHDIEGYTGDHLWKLMGFKDKVSLKLMQGWFWGMRNIWLYRVCTNMVTGIWLQVQFWMHLSTSMWD